MTRWKKNRVTVFENHAVIHLHGARGGKAFVDLDDVERVVALGSLYLGSNGTPVVSHKRGLKTYLHRFIMDAKHTEMVDFVDGDKLNCQKENLVKIPAERRPHGSGGGVVHVPSKDRWRAHPSINGKRVHLGYFETEAEARAAIEAAHPRPNRNLVFDRAMNAWRAYGKDGTYLGRFEHEQDARDRRDAYDNGTWTKDRTRGVYFDKEHQKWRATARDGKYLGRFDTKDEAIQAQRDYHDHGPKAVPTRRRGRDKAPRRKKGERRDPPPGDGRRKDGDLL